MVLGGHVQSDWGVGNGNVLNCRLQVMPASKGVVTICVEASRWLCADVEGKSRADVL